MRQTAQEVSLLPRKSLVRTDGEARSLNHQQIFLCNRRVQVAHRRSLPWEPGWGAWASSSEKRLWHSHPASRRHRTAEELLFARPVFVLPVFPYATPLDLRTSY